MQFITLPGYQPSRPLDFSPITESFDRNQRNALARAAQAMQERQIGLQEQRFGLEQRDSDRQHTNALARQAEFARFMANPGAIKDPATLAAIRLGGADQAGSMIMQGRNADLQRAQMDTQRRLAEAQIAAQNANLQQVRMQTPDWRMQNAARFGIDVNTPHGKAWVIGGTYTPPGPMDEFMRGLAGQVQGQGAAQTAPPSGAPAPRVQPQSNTAPPGDPMLIPTQAAPAPGGPTASPPATVNTPVGPMTEQQARMLGFGLAMSGRGDAGKMITEAAERDKLGKEAANENDKKELAAIEALSRLRNIAQGFRPEWLTYENRAKQYGISLVDSFETVRKRLRPEDLQSHAEYTMFVRDAMSNLTQGIKDATGAAMGIQEEARIRAGLPDPAKDSPTQFVAKLKGTMRELELTVARTRYLRANGFKGQPWTGTGREAERDMPVGEFRRTIDRDGNQLQQQYRAARPQAPQAEIDAFVKGELRSRYGIGI